MTDADLALMGIDAATILYVWSWGFSTIVFGWLMGYGVALAIGLIKKV